MGIEMPEYPNARRLTKIKPNEIFNDVAISWEPFHEIDSNFFILKIWTRKYHQTLDPIARKFPKLEPNENSSSLILVFKLNNQLNIS